MIEGSPAPDRNLADPHLSCATPPVRDPADPRLGRFSGYLSYANSLGIGQYPISGGLFLDNDDTALITRTIGFRLRRTSGMRRAVGAGTDHTPRVTRVEHVV